MPQTATGSSTDLLSLAQTPWSIPLYDLVNRISYTVLSNQLIHDGLISPPTLEKWAKQNLPHGSERPRAGSVLYYLHQPFFHRFDKHFLSFYTVTGEKIGFCHTSTFTRVCKHGHPVLPYGGESLSHRSRPGVYMIISRRKRHGSTRTLWRGQGGLVRSQNTARFGR